MAKESAQREFNSYQEEISTRFPLAIKMLYLGDTIGLPREGHEDIWSNVSEHCFKQAQGCEVLADALGLNEPIKNNIAYAAIVHDWDKKTQMADLRKIDAAIKTGEISDVEAGKLKYAVFNASEIRSAQGMRENGIPNDVIQIAGADGHLFFPRYFNEKPTFQEKIFHYLGSITEGVNIVPLDERIDVLITKPAYKSMNEYGSELKWTNGKTLYETQREIGHQIEREIVNLLISSRNIDETWKLKLKQNPKQLPEFISTKIIDQFSY